LLLDAITDVTGIAVPPPGVPGPFALADADRLRQLFADTGFNAFKAASVKGIRVPGGGDTTRARLDALTDKAKHYGAKGLVWMRVGPELALDSPVAKFLSPDEQVALPAALEAAEADSILALDQCLGIPVLQLAEGSDVGHDGDLMEISHLDIVVLGVALHREDDAVVALDGLLEGGHRARASSRQGPPHLPGKDHVVPQRNEGEGLQVAAAGRLGGIAAHGWVGEIGGRVVRHCHSRNSDRVGGAGRAYPGSSRANPARSSACPRLIDTAQSRSKAAP